MGDVPSLVELVVGLDGERGQRSQVEETRRVIVECIQSEAHDIVVAQREDRVAGYLALHWVPFPMLHGYEAYISDLLIHQAARGHGMGSLLLADAERRARQRGCRRLMLNNRMLAESFKRGFFARAGFEQRGDFAGFVKPIDPPPEPGREPA